MPSNRKAPLSCPAWTSRRSRGVSMRVGVGRCPPTPPTERAHRCFGCQTGMALVGFQGLILTWVSATLNSFICPCKKKDSKDDAGHKNRIVHHCDVHDPGIQ